MSFTSTTEKIRSVLESALKPDVLEVHNDSHKHVHHAAMRNATNTTESHYRLVIVSSKFDGLTLPQRHRLVYGLLGDDLKRENGVHALQLKTKAPGEPL